MPFAARLCTARVTNAEQAEDSVTAVRRYCCLQGYNPSSSRQYTSAAAYLDMGGGLVTPT